MRLVAGLKARVLSVVRRGPRTVLWVPEGMNLGNFLYHWMRAWDARRNNREVSVLLTAAQTPWLPLFPAAQPLVLSRGQIGLRDLREMGMHQVWGEDFDKEMLQAFVRAVVLTSAIFSDDPLPGAPGPEDVVVNIRRGDYYSNRGHHDCYAFNTEDYLHRALTLTAARGAIPRIHVVSDGIDWCRTNLGWLAQHAGTLSFAAHGLGPAGDFRTLALARRLVLTNTTFGYWGAYVSNTLHGDNRADVVAPWFHARIGDFAADQLDPDWQQVTEVSGGWAQPPPFAG